MLAVAAPAVDHRPGTASGTAPGQPLAVDDVLGSLAPGKVADIAIFDGSANADHRAVIDAQPQDLEFEVVNATTGEMQRRPGASI